MSALVTTARPALLLFLSTMPWLFVLISSRSGHDGARMAQMGLWALVALAVAVGGGERLIRRRHIGWCALLLLFALGLVWRAPMPLWAGLELALWLGGICVAMLVARMARQDGPWRGALAWGLLAGTVLPQLLDLLVMLAGQFQGIAPRPTLLGAGYDNYRFLNHVQTVSLPLAAVAPAWLGQAPRARALALMALAMGGAVLWATGARASMLGLGLAWGGIGLVGGVAGRLALRTGLQALPLAALLYGLVWIALPGWLGLPTEGGLVARFDPHALSTEMARWTLWQEAWQAWLRSPWWGIGPMHLAQWPNRYAMHPHQWLLQWLAEWGLWMTLAVVGAVAVWLLQRWRAWRRLSATEPRASDALAAGAFIAVAAGLIDAQFSGSFVMPMPQVWIAVAWGVLAGCTPAPAEEASSTVQVRLGGVLRAGVAAGLLAALGWVAAQWPPLDERLKQAEQAHVGSKTQPRFWSHGRLIKP